MKSIKRVQCGFIVLFPIPLLVIALTTAGIGYMVHKESDTARAKNETVALVQPTSEAPKSIEMEIQK